MLMVTSKRITATLQQSQFITTAPRSIRSLYLQVNVGIFLLNPWFKRFKAEM